MTELIAAPAADPLGKRQVSFGKWPALILGTPLSEWLISLKLNQIRRKSNQKLLPGLGRVDLTKRLNSGPRHPPATSSLKEPGLFSCFHGIWHGFCCVSSSRDETAKMGIRGVLLRRSRHPWQDRARSTMST